MALKSHLPGAWPRRTAVAVALLGLVVLSFGHGLGLEWVCRPFSAGAGMGPGTAIALTVCGAALWLLAGAGLAPVARRVTQGLVAGVMLFALASVVRWLAVNLAAVAPPAFPHLEPSLSIAASLLGGGAALFLLLQPPQRTVRLNLIQCLAAGSAFVLLPVSSGGLSALARPHELSPYLNLAPLPAMGLFALAVATLFVRPDPGTVAGFLRSTPTPARVTRRLVLAGILLPALSSVGESAMLAAGVSHELCEGISECTQIVALCVLAAYIGWVLQRTERRRDHAEKERTDAQRHVEHQAAVLQSEVARRTSELSRALLFNQRLALVASRTTNAVLVTNPAGQIEWVNDGFTRITGYSFEDAAGRRPGELLQGQRTDPATSAHMRERLAAGLGFDVEVINYARDGREYWNALEVQPMHDPAGRLMGFTGIGSDITARKLAEERMHAAKEEAEQLNVALEAAIARAQQSATEANLASQAKSSFLATMSHEIRTPLNGVIGMASLLRDTRLDPLQLDFVRTIETSGDALLAIINDILDYSKIEAGRIELESAPFDPRQCVEDALDLFATKAAAKNLELVCQIEPGVPAAIVGDVTRLRQIVVNLVSNALKFTATGEVVVTLGCGAATDGRHELHGAVRDSGIGIPAGRISRLFQPFSQVDSSTTRKYGGSGLGLAISHRLAEAMGGRMWVESEEGRGSVFHFTFMAAEEVLDVRPAEPDAAAVLAGRTVLVAVGNSVVRAFVVRLVTGWGAAVAEAPEPDELRRRLASGAAWDLILIDRAFGESEGWPGPEHARQLPGAGELRLVLLSFPTGGALETGFVARFSKPLKPAVMLEWLRRYYFRKSVAPVQPGPGETAPAAADPSLLRVLLVEDNPVNQRVALMLLTKLGHRARVATNGEEAVADILREPADVVLMDMEMPVMDGCEATRRIRAAPGLAQPWIMALTANAMNADRLRAMASGMNDFVPKPIRLSDLSGAFARAQAWRAQGAGQAAVVEVR